MNNEYIKDTQMSRAMASDTYGQHTHAHAHAHAH